MNTSTNQTPYEHGPFKNGMFQSAEYRFQVESDDFMGSMMVVTIDPIFINVSGIHEKDEGGDCFPIHPFVAWFMNEYPGGQAFDNKTNDPAGSRVLASTLIENAYMAYLAQKPA